MNYLNDFPAAERAQLLAKQQSKVITGQNKDFTMPKTGKQSEYKKDILDIFSEKVINKHDVTDMVKVPRSIFKGYLCFTVGTAINTIASVLKKGKLSAGLTILGSLTAIYGTFNFVKPFLVRDENK